MTANKTSEFVESIGISLAEKKHTLSRLFAVKEEHIIMLDSSEVRNTPFSIVLGHSSVSQTPKIANLRYR